MSPWIFFVGCIVFAIVYGLVGMLCFRGFIENMDFNPPIAVLSVIALFALFIIPMGICFKVSLDNDKMREATVSTYCTECTECGWELESDDKFCGGYGKAVVQ